MTIKAIDVNLDIQKLLRITENKEDLSTLQVKVNVQKEDDLKYDQVIVGEADPNFKWIGNKLQVKFK